MQLVDTSSWIEALRDDGEPVVRERVFKLLENGEAAWCDVVRAELWRGAKYGAEQTRIGDLEMNVIRLDIDQAVWDLVIDLAKRSRSAGKTLPVTDLIVFACARRHNVQIEHKDRHFEYLADLK